MADKIKPGDLRAAIESTLTIYGQEVEDAVERTTKQSMDDLVSRTRATAPKGRRGKFRKKISSQKLPSTRGSRYLWFVKAPDHRLTHLVVNGHAKKNGGRTKGNPFLSNALNAVLPDYEEKMEEAIRNGGG